MQKFVVYYRVSTQKQGNSGLGLEGQREAVSRFTNNCRECILKEFSDIESGKHNNRAKLLQAIELCKKSGAKLLIAKLDRLSRNAGFIFSLRDSGVDFVCCDMPEANTLTIGVLATMAQYERELISTRTKAALEAKKKRDNWKPGNPNGWTTDAQEKATESKQAAAKANEKTIRAKAALRDIIQLATYKSESLSIATAANRLNAYNLKTPKGKPFTPSNVRYLLNQVLPEMGLQSLPR